VLHRFYRKVSDGGGPAAGLVFDSKGNLYGTTKGGGTNGWGTVFGLDPPKQGGSWTETILYDFGNAGYQPLGGIALNAKGDFYVTTSGGNTFGGGTLFQLRRSGGRWDCTVLHDFTGDPDGAYPIGGLVFNNAGDLFGTTQLGGTGQNCGTGNCGALFEFEPQ
jgi:hypothetical protein